MASIGVGLIGAGPVTQAIHLPTLARLRRRFHVAHISDVDGELASEVAARTGSRWSTTAGELLADPTVEVVCVGSPHRFHADHVVAACRAGKRAVLCEKPLGVSVHDAHRVVEASRRYGVPVLVGTMHVFDPGWDTTTKALAGQLGEVHTVRSRIVMPRNSRTEDQASQISGRRPSDGGPVGERTRAETAALVRDQLLGLAVHDIPHVRRFVPEVHEVHSVAILDPWGYSITLVGHGRRLVQLMGYIHDQWRLDWSFEALSCDAWLTVEFPPSYVHAGSSRATLRRADGLAQVVEAAPDNGYLREWQTVWDVLEAGAEAPDLESSVDDLAYALGIADLVTDHLLEHA